MNKSLNIAGIFTSGTGGILDTDITVRFSNEILNDQVAASYPSRSGDSGASIFEITGPSSATLLGQHVGRACWVDLNSGTNYVYFCNDGLPGLKIFSPWDQVETHLEI